MNEIKRPVPPPEHPLWLHMLFPAVAMTLGWGLRGYIGGGPFGAMIPGAFVALGASLMLGHSVAFAAVVACFGAIGIGFGGEMTYGQTLGLAKAADTRVWGMIGVTVKGAVWGLLGGAVLGAGLTHRQYPRKTVIIAFLLTIAGFYLGWKFINQPKLIYFSDPVNKPREETWAGLLLAAIVFIGFITAKGRGIQGRVPLSFALVGMIGGALGFGLGTLWLVYGSEIPVEQKWWGWWKMMEFSFGLLLGASLGLAVWLNRRALAEADPGGRPPPDAGANALVMLVAVSAMFLWGLPSMLSSTYGPERDIAALLATFVTFGALCILFGLHSEITAWHVAISLTFLHTVLDLDDSLFGKDGYAVSKSVHVLAPLIATAIVGWLVHRLRRGRQPIRDLYLLVLWACYLTGFVRTFVKKSLIDSGGFVDTFIKEHSSMVVVQGIFTITAMITTVMIVWIAGRHRIEADRQID